MLSFMLCQTSPVTFISLHVQYLTAYQGVATLSLAQIKQMERQMLGTSDTLFISGPLQKSQLIWRHFWWTVRTNQDRNIFYWHNWIPHPQKHMHRHQFCGSNCPRTQVMAQNVISRFRWRPFWKWPKTGSPSQLFFYGIDFWYRGRSKEQKNLVSDCPGGGGGGGAR